LLEDFQTALQQVSRSEDDTSTKDNFVQAVGGTLRYAQSAELQQSRTTGYSGNSENRSLACP